MWRTLALVVAVAGCDKLFDVTPVSVVDARSPASPDAPNTDAPPPPPCQPHTFVGTAQIVTTGFPIAAVAETVDLALVGGVSFTSRISYLQPILGSSPTSTSVIDRTNLGMGLTPDGLQLFVFQNSNSPAGVYRYGEAMANMPQLWGAGIHVDSLGLQHPSAVAVVGGELHMMTSGTTSFQEFTSSDSGTTWSVFGGQLDASTFARTGTIASPNLTIDGHTVVFVNGMTIAYAQRVDPTKPFDMQQLVVDSLVAETAPLASPFLTSDCGHLYAVQSVGGSTFVRY